MTGGINKTMRFEELGPPEMSENTKDHNKVARTFSQRTSVPLRSPPSSRISGDDRARKDSKHQSQTPITLGKRTPPPTGSTQPSK